MRCQPVVQPGGAKDRVRTVRVDLVLLNERSNLAVHLFRGRVLVDLPVGPRGVVGPHLELTLEQGAMHALTKTVHSKMRVLVGRDAGVQLPHGVGGHWASVANVPMHQLHGGLMVLENQQQKIGVNVGVFFPDHVLDKPMLQQRGGCAPIDGVEAFDHACLNRPQPFQSLDSPQQSLLHIGPRPKLVPPLTPRVQKAEVVLEFGFGQGFDGFPCVSRVTLTRRAPTLLMFPGRGFLGRFEVHHRSPLLCGCHSTVVRSTATPGSDLELRNPETVVPPTRHRIPCPESQVASDWAGTAARPSGTEAIRCRHCDIADAQQPQATAHGDRRSASPHDQSTGGHKEEPVGRP